MTATKPAPKVKTASTKAKGNKKAAPKRAAWSMPKLEVGDDETYAPEIARARKIEETSPCEHCRELAGWLIDMYETNEYNEEAVARAHANETVVREVLFQIARVNRSLDSIGMSKHLIDKAISKCPELKPYESSKVFRDVDKALERLDGVMERRSQVEVVADA